MAMARESGKVAVRNTCLVAPVYGNAHVDHHERKKKLRPSAAAHMLWFVPYRTRLLFFQKPALGFDAVVAKLKSSLGKALAEFYPLAGRLLVTESDHGLRMDVICNDKGVLFIEATAGEVTLEELAKDSVCGHFEGIPGELVEELSQCGEYNISFPWSFDAPLFIIQVTRLGCGGICMAIKFNHQLLDGSGTWNFVKAWAEVCSGQPMSLKPVVMEAPPSIAICDDLKEDYKLPPGYLRYQNSGLIQNLGTKNTSPGKFDMKCFGFTKATIDKMKLANPGFSSFQLLTSFIWSKTIAARNLKDTDSTGISFAGNCRGRIESVPEGFVGMAAVYDQIVVEVSKLRDGNELRNGAFLIKNKIRDWLTEEGVQAYSKLVSHGGKETTAFPHLVSGTGLVIGSSFYFPVFNDFGFGKPVGASILRVYEDGKLYYFPGREGGDVVAYIALESSALEKLAMEFNEPSLRLSVPL